MLKVFILSLFVTLCMCSIPARLRHIERMEEVNLFFDQFLINQTYCIGMTEGKNECVRKMIYDHFCDDNSVFYYDGVSLSGRENITERVQQLFTLGTANRKLAQNSVCERHDGTFIAHSAITAFITGATGSVLQVSGVDIAHIRYCGKPCVDLYYETDNLRNVVHPQQMVLNPGVIYPEPEQIVNLNTCDWVML
jgi:hypothetical protein